MLGLLFSAVALSQTASITPTQFTPEQLIADLRLAHQIFDADDAGMYRYVSRAELDLVWKKAEAKLSKPMDSFGFYRVLRPVICAQKCGHSGVSLPETDFDAITKNPTLLPLFVKVLPTGTFVYRDLSRGTPNYDGSRILSINQVSVAHIVKTMRAAAPIDGNSPDGKRERISGQSFSLYLRALIGLEAPFSVEVIRPGNHRETVELDGVDLDTFHTRAVDSKAEPDGETPAAFHLLNDGKIGLLKIQGFFDKEGGEPTEKIFETAFKQLAEKKSKSLIIDVRDNGGGEDSLGRQLLSYFESKPFKYYDHLILNSTFLKSSSITGNYQRPPDNFLTRRADGKYEISGHPNWGIMQPLQPHFAGKVYILTNGLSFSTTCEFLSHIKSERLATLIGEDTGGNYYGNTSGLTTTVPLPNTKLRLRVPSVAYWITVDPRYPADSPIRPDIRIVPTIQDLVSGKDAVMEKALQLARK